MTINLFNLHRNTMKEGFTPFYRQQTEPQRSSVTVVSYSVSGCTSILTFRLGSLRSHEGDRPELGQDSGAQATVQETVFGAGQWGMRRNTGAEVLRGLWPLRRLKRGIFWSQLYWAKRWERPLGALMASSHSRRPGREGFKLFPSLLSLGKSQSEQAHKTYLNWSL